MNSLEVDGYSVNVILMDMKHGIYEEVVKNKDDSYSIFLNSRYNDETLRDAFNHAVLHIKRNDWEKESVQIIEAEAHGIGVEDVVFDRRIFDDMIKRLRKEREKIQKKLRTYEKKYAGMKVQDMWLHNDQILKLRDDE